MKIGIIIGSTRQNRVGESVARFVLDVAQERGDAAYELIDLREFHLPMFDGPVPPGALGGRYDDEAVTAWAAKIAEMDGFVFVTPEYNHSVPAPFKNAVDSIYPEWGNKAVGFVSYGFNEGVRAVEHWRGVVANLHLYAVRAAVGFNLVTEMQDGAFAPGERRRGEVNGLLDQVVPLAGALKALRS